MFVCYVSLQSFCCTVIDFVGTYGKSDADNNVVFPLGKELDPDSKYKNPKFLPNLARYTFPYDVDIDPNCIPPFKSLLILIMI